MTIHGTAHFVNFTKACDYYRNQGNDELTPAELETPVRDKIAEGDISLGKPDVPVGAKLLLSTTAPATQSRVRNMLYVNVIRNGAKIESASVVDAATLELSHKSPGHHPTTWENRNDWKTYEAAAEVAAYLNAASLSVVYQATDAGQYVSPRYDIIDLPQIGQEVSYTFNGDYYPCGKIVSISKGPAFRRIVARDDKGRTCVFHRRCRGGRPTGGAWVMDGTWSLIQGYHNRLSPEF